MQCPACSIPGYVMLVVFCHFIQNDYRFWKKILSFMEKITITSGEITITDGEITIAKLSSDILSTSGYVILVGVCHSIQTAVPQEFSICNLSFSVRNLNFPYAIFRM